MYSLEYLLFDVLQYVRLHVLAERYITRYEHLHVSTTRVVIVADLLIAERKEWTKA